MTRYKRHIFRCTAMDFLGVQEGLLASGASWRTNMVPFSSPPEVGVIAIIVDETGFMTYTCRPETVELFVSRGYSSGGYSVETKRYFTLDEPTIRLTLNINGSVYDKEDVLLALKASQVVPLVR